jgi:hypothetical protein
MLETFSLSADVITDTEQSVPVSVLCKTLSALRKVIGYDSNAFFETTMGLTAVDRQRKCEAESLIFRCG